MFSLWTSFEDCFRYERYTVVAALDHFEFEENKRPIVCFNIVDEQNSEVHFREEVLFFYELTKDYNDNGYKDVGTKNNIILYIKDNDGYFNYDYRIIPLLLVDSVKKLREFEKLDNTLNTTRMRNELYKENSPISNNDKNNLLQYFRIKIPYGIDEDKDNCQESTFYFHDLNTKEFILRYNNSYYHPTLVYRYKNVSTNKWNEEELFFKYQLKNLINLLPKKEEDPIVIEYNKRTERGVKAKEARIKNTSKKKVSYIIMTNGSYDSQKVRYYFENGQSIPESTLTREGIDINTEDFQIHAFSDKSSKDTILLSNEFFNIEDLKLSKRTVNGIEMIEADLPRAKNSVLALIPLKINKEALDRVLSPENRLLLELV